MLGRHASELELILIFRRKCWKSIRSKLCEPEFKTCGKRSPVSLETCYTVPGWKERGYDVDYILAQGLRWHVSTVNIKSSPIPANGKAKFEEFQKKIGYRFILRRLEYSKT